jgi:hypothetical protein
MKGNSSCHIPNDKYRKGYDAIVWDSKLKEKWWPKLKAAVEVARAKEKGLPSKK